MSRTRRERTSLLITPLVLDQFQFLPARFLCFRNSPATVGGDVTCPTPFPSPQPFQSLDRMMEPVDRGFRLFELGSEDRDDIELGHGTTSLIHITRA